MWVFLALASAFLLGLYDVSKKQALTGNAVIPVLALNTFFCSCIFLPFIILSACGALSESSGLFVPSGGWREHSLVVLKAVIVLSSWVCGYFATKHLPLTLVGPVNATRPVWTLIGSLLIFGESLNLWQWAGVAVAIFSFLGLSRTEKKEGINFRDNRWVSLLVAAALLGAVSALFDKYLMAAPENGGAGLDRLFTQGWYNFYQFWMMLAIFLLTTIYDRRARSGNKSIDTPGQEVTRLDTSFHWRWSIPLISIFLSAADFLYFYALTDSTALIAVVSMIRRSSVLVSFTFGAILFHEHNLKSKAIDLLFITISLILLFFGSLQ